MDKNIAARALIEDYLAQASVSDSAEARDNALASARELAEKCVLAYPDDSDYWFVAGLAMYDSFVVDEAYGNQAEQYLKRSLKLDDNHQFARLYLGHYYYDAGRYEDALFHFEKVTDSYFLSANKEWRILKLHELILCCKLRLNHSDINIDRFNSLIQEFDQIPPEDVPVPLEMAVTLVETKASLIWQRINRAQALKLFVSFIERQSFKETLQDYVAAF
jgi:tetratricopeptide (TPR) repeat protein